MTSSAHASVSAEFVEGSPSADMNESSSEEEPDDTLPTEFDDEDFSAAMDIDEILETTDAERLKHTLVLNDTTLICPYELLFTAADEMAAGTCSLIPDTYDPQLFVGKTKSPPPLMSRKRSLADMIEHATHVVQTGETRAFGKDPFDDDIVPTAQLVSSTTASTATTSAMSSKETSAKAMMSLDQSERDSVGIPKPLESEYSASVSVAGGKQRSTSSRRKASVSVEIRDSAAVDEGSDLFPVEAVSSSAAGVQLQPAHAQAADAMEATTGGYDTLQWIQCEKCLKWRRIPNTVDADSFKSWQCSQNVWDPLHASCESPEEDWDVKTEQTITVSAKQTEQFVKEKTEFFGKLKQFYAENWKLGHTIEDLDDVRVGDKKLDFYQLFLEVMQRGGYSQVNARNDWQNLFNCLSCFDASLITSAVPILQSNFRDYLLPYCECEAAKVKEEVL